MARTNRKGCGMRREVLSPSVTLYLGDCREIMPQMSSVEACVTDPPYTRLVGGIDRKTFGSPVGRRLTSSLSIGDPWKATFEWAPLAWRIARHGLMVFCSNWGIAEVERAFPAARTVCTLTWHKINAPPTGKNVPRYTTEHIVALSKAPGIKWDRLRSTLIDVPGLAAGCFAGERVLVGNKALHPAQKPIAVMMPLVSICEGTILDPFMGLGSTGIAAVRAGKGFVGIEQNPDYFDVAKRRISDALSRPEMFAPSIARSA
jgi:site-specific DNA-methyltransferase (adenine-specific)